MRQRIRTRAVIVLMLAIFTASCDQATELTAPTDDVQYKLNARNISRILGGLEGGVSGGNPSQLVDRDGAVLSLEIGGVSHLLIVEKNAVKNPTRFTMTLGSTTLNDETINFLDLNATTDGSSSQNDAGGKGFKGNTVVLCMNADQLDVPTSEVEIYWLRDNDKNLVRMRKVGGSNGISVDADTYVCANIPHFSGFVMGAN